MEFKKNFGSPALLFLLGLLILLNGILFYQTQKTQDGGYGKEAGKEYLLRLKQLKQNGQEVVDIASALEEVTKEYETFDNYLLLHNYLTSMESGQNYEYLQELYQELLTQKGIDEIPETLPELNEIYSGYYSRQRLKSQLTYLNEYSERIQSILENAEKMSGISMFAKEGSFSKKNITKTAEDFQKIKERQLEIIPIQGISAWMKETRTDYLAVGFLLLFVAEFLRERKKGLWQIIHASAAGRSILAFQRIGVLLAAGVLLPLLFYGSTFFLSVHFYGEWTELADILKAPIQSLPEFGHCILRCSIGSFLILRFILKAAVLASFGVLFYAVMSVFESIAGAVLAVGTVLGIQYLAFWFIPVQSFANVFKYINLYPLLAAREIFTEYQNLNIFTVPVSAAKGAYIGLAVLFLAGSSLVILIQVKKYPVSSGIGLVRKCMDWTRRKLSFLSRQTGKLSGEFFKQQVTGKGVVVLAFLLLLVLSMFPKEPLYWSEKDGMLQIYYDQLKGKVTEQTVEFLENRRQELSEKVVSQAHAEAFYEFDIYVQGLLEYEKETGNTLWVVNPYGYIAYYYPSEERMDSFTNEKIFADKSRALLALLGVVLLTATLIPTEKQKGTFRLLRASKDGRGRLFAAKLAIVAGGSLLVWGIVYGIEFAGMVKLYGLPCLGAPLQSILKFRESFFSGSIGQYLLLIYGLRLFVLFVVSLLTLGLTSFFAEQRPALLISVFVILFPVVLSLIGISNMPGNWMLDWVIAKGKLLEMSGFLTYFVPLFGGIAGGVVAGYRWIHTAK